MTTVPVIQFRGRAPSQLTLVGRMHHVDDPSSYVPVYRGPYPDTLMAFPQVDVALLGSTNATDSSIPHILPLTLKDHGSVVTIPILGESQYRFEVEDTMLKSSAVGTVGNHPAIFNTGVTTAVTPVVAHGIVTRNLHVEKQS